MIDPNVITTARVGDLPSADFNLTDNIPHEIGTDLKRGTVQQLADFISNYIGSSSSLSFNPTTVTSGGTLPVTTTNEWILVGKGTFQNVGGGLNITTTEELNALTSNGTYWALSVSLNLLEEGCYYIEKTVGEGDGKIELQSETFMVRESHPGTLLYKFFNSFNNEVFWENLSYIMLRVEGEIKQYDTNGIRRVYVDQPNTSQTIKGVSSRQFKLFAGSSLGIPDYLADKLQTIFDQDNVDIDGKGFSALNSGAKFNPERADLYSFAGWSLDIAETTNRRAKRFESTGIIEKKVVIDYFAESKLFGPIDGNAENTDYFISNIE